MQAEVWVYAWRLTFGGRPSLPNEYRIQMTSVSSPLNLSPQHTLLLGYEPNTGVFAGFDLTKHSTFTPGSSSVQIDIGVVRRALEDGLAFDRKGNDEIAEGIRPDHLLFYAFHSQELHKAGGDAQALKLLERVAEQHQPKLKELEPVAEERKRVVRQVATYTRAANCRHTVWTAYGNRCAVTRLQLRIVEAAHILPVSEGADSIDAVQNGLVLSPNYHKAFDRGLIFLDDKSSMRINSKIVSDLRGLGLDGGLADFQMPLGKIHLPADKNQWPSLKLISKGNALRRVTI
ncbi:MAG: HNH endonuclease [SAR202 cluster bacterium]|nr:HNH endonuclease [SAR202 cluster bacterium]